MNGVDIQYQDLLRKIITTGIEQEDRTGTGTFSLFGEKMEFDLTEGFPILTTKDVWYKGVLHELLWFISGNTNIKYLVDNKVYIWNEWAYRRYNNFSNLILTHSIAEILNTNSKKSYYNNFTDILLKEYFSIERARTDCPIYTQEEFIERIRVDAKFAEIWGDLGPVYGSQWVNWNGLKINQLQNVINTLKTDPDSRRIIVNAWNVEKIPSMALDPCHAFFQFYSVKYGNGKRKLSMYWLQRSVDTFLGLPFNIASYATLLTMVAAVTNHEPHKLIAFLGNTHLYKNHIEQANIQMQREPFPLPKLEINSEINSIFDYKYQDFKLINYQKHSKIHADISV